MARYDKYPLLGVITCRSGDVDDDDLKITKDIFERLSMNFKSKLVLFETIDRPIQEVANEISGF